MREETSNDSGTGSSKTSRPKRRTNRWGPRILAIFIILLCAASYASGIQQLRANQTQYQSPFDILFTEGESSWNVFNSDGACLGSIHSIYTRGEEHSLDLEGSFGTHTLSATFVFDKLSSLEELQGVLSLEHGSYAFYSHPEKDNMLVLELSTNDVNRALSIKRPKPIFLIELEEKKQILHYPPVLSHLPLIGEAFTEGNNTFSLRRKSESQCEWREHPFSVTAVELGEKLDALEASSPLVLEEAFND